jgi:hypothetical protein
MMMALIMNPPQGGALFDGGVVVFCMNVILYSFSYCYNDIRPRFAALFGWREMMRTASAIEFNKTGYSVLQGGAAWRYGRAPSR